MTDRLTRLLQLDDLVAGLSPDVPATAVLTGGRIPPGARRVGVLPGSFNPPTDAHWHLAVAALESNKVDAAAFLLSVRTVNKEVVTGLHLADRLLLLGELAATRDGLAVVATNRGLYVDHAEALHRLLPGGMEIVFLTGFDKIEQIFDPRYYVDRDADLDRLFAVARILVAPRSGHDAADLAALLARPENRPYAARVEPLPLPPGTIDPGQSATRIRDDLAAGRPLAGMPPVVARFLVESGAFAPHLVLPGGERIDRYGLWRGAVRRVARDGRPPEAAEQRLASLLARALESTAAGRELRRTLLSEGSAQAT